MTIETEATPRPIDGATAKYLADKPDRTFPEFAQLLSHRIKVDNPADDAKLVIAYSGDGPFQRVLLRGMRGSDLKAMVSAVNSLDALVALRNEVAALQPFENAIREAIGNTNYTCLMHRLKAALASGEGK